MIFNLINNFLFIFILIKCLISKQEYPEYINEYFNLISTIDKPLSLNKYYNMRQSSIDYYPGTMNMILSVPHDGDIQSNLPKRPKAACRKLNSTSKKCYYQNPCLLTNSKIDMKYCSISHGRDINTRLLALSLRYELNKLFHLKPFVIINRLERTKVDMNRFIDEGTFGTANSMHAWIRYHFYLKYARELIINNEYNFNRKGLLFDLHSHVHEQGWVELGYLITSRQLLTKKYNLNSSSLALYLTKLFQSNQLIIGNKSLGYFIMKYNYLATPSPIFPSPSDQSYYEWGYTIEEYGRYKNFSAIMIESPSNELLNLTKLYFYAKSLALAIHDYIIEIELFESLIHTEILNKDQNNRRCNSNRQMTIQLSFYLLLFVNLINFI